MSRPGAMRTHTSVARTSLASLGRGLGSDRPRAPLAATTSRVSTYEDLRVTLVTARPPTVPTACAV